MPILLKNSLKNPYSFILIVSIIISLVGWCYLDTPLIGVSYYVILILRG